ncbi:hypothetical protein C8Q78DRAFT_1026776 [Trametes maxima]|nr:hypothetical protein C8Q78DRAFT_1026776 [Trametes maxima]
MTTASSRSCSSVYLVEQTVYTAPLYCHSRFPSDGGAHWTAHWRPGDCRTLVQPCPESDSSPLSLLAHSGINRGNLQVHNAPSYGQSVFYLRVVILCYLSNPMSEPSRKETSTVSESPTHGILLVTPPVYTRSEEEYAAALLFDTIRHNITVPSNPNVNAPHGFYVVNNPDSSDGDKEIFSFFSGDNIHAALAATRAQATMQPAADAGNEEMLMYASTAGRQPHSSADDNTASSPLILEADRGLPQPPSLARVPATNRPEFRAITPRIIEPLRADVPYESIPPAILRTPSSVPLSTLQIGILPMDNNSLIPMSLGATPEIARKRRLYVLEMKLDEIAHPHHVQTVYQMPIDTAGSTTWIFGHGFKKIPDMKCVMDPVPWTTEDRRTTELTKRRYIAPNKTGQHEEFTSLVDFATDRAPEFTDEWLVHYGDGGAAYVRQMPEQCDLKVSYNCWSWKGNNTTSSAETVFRIHCLLAYAANTALVNQPFDGNIGLAVPGFPNLPEGAEESSPKFTRRNFFDALERYAPVVEQPRRFLIKFNHPDNLVACLKKNARDFLYFGDRFPCVIKPQFTPKIPLIHHGDPDKQGGASAKYRDWMTELQSMSLIAPGEPLDKNPLYTIDFSRYGRPETSDGRPTEAKMPVRGIRVTFDTGSTRSYLPAEAVDTISSVWLKNDPLIVEELDHHYIGPERDLDECDILFRFTGADGDPIDFQCAAKLFLKSPWPAARTSTSRKGLSRISISPDFDVNSLQYTFGLNFFWAAFVEHSAPAIGLSVYGDIQMQEPYIRLVPQRAKLPNGEMGSPHDFSLFSDLPPKYFLEPTET